MSTHTKVVKRRAERPPNVVKRCEKRRSEQAKKQDTEWNLAREKAENAKKQTLINAVHVEGLYLSMSRIHSRTAHSVSADLQRNRDKYMALKIDAWKQNKRAAAVLAAIYVARYLDDRTASIVGEYI